MLRGHVQEAKDTGQRLLDMANYAALSEDQLSELCHACTLLKHNDQSKLAKWQTRARQQAFMDKGCASKQFFKHLHHSRVSQTIERVKLAFGEWTSSLQELAQALVSHYKCIFEAPPNPSPEALQARHLFLSHVCPTNSQATELDRPFTEMKLH